MPPPVIGLAAEHGNSHIDALGTQCESPWGVIYERTEALGCDGCHGPGGRLARANPGSFKGYVPSWDSADFPELVRDSTEFREWVENGVSRRLDANAFATYFLRRAVLHMPHYRDHLESDDVAALWAYVQWLRATAAKRGS